MPSTDKTDNPVSCVARAKLVLAAMGARRTQGKETRRSVAPVSELSRIPITLLFPIFQFRARDYMGAGSLRGTAAMRNKQPKNVDVNTLRSNNTRGANTKTVSRCFRVLDLEHIRCGQRIFFLMACACKQTCCVRRACFLAQDLGGRQEPPIEPNQICF